MPRTIKLAAINAGRVLLVYKEETRQWSLPGGKMRPTKEKEIKCLRRELSEEIPKLQVRKLRRWRRFNCRMRALRFTITVYFGKVSGPLITAHEIDAAAWIARWDRVSLSPNTRRILLLLAKFGYLKR